MQVYNALQLKKGAKVEQQRLGSITQPLQFIPRKEKDVEWAAWNLDWLEWNGLKQLRNIYREEGIDFDRYMDTNTDAMGMATDEEYIQVGVFMGDDLYGVASYNTKTKRFIIDENEISDSINAYREDNQ